MTDFYDIKLNLFCHLNPQTAILKNHVVKKIGMECLTPFCREINGFSEELFSAGSKFKNGDTLLARITPCLENGKTAFVNILGGDEVAFGSTEFIILREKQGVSDALFLYYFAISSDFRKRAISLMSGTSGRQRVDAKILGEEVFSLPPLDVQKRIAGILGTLDDRIDVLRRENVVLEQMAQAVFQSWFVDFDIVRAKAAGTPESEVCEKYHITPELYALFPSALTPDDLPLGWEKKNLGDISQYSKEKTTNVNIETYVSTENMLPNYGGIEKASSVPETGQSTRYKAGNVLISNIRPYFKKIWFADREGSCSNDVLVFSSNSIGKCMLYSILAQDAFFDFMMSGANGDKMPRGNKKHIMTYPVIFPNMDLLNKFENLVASLFDKKSKNAQQIRALSATRDALLPKLMNGEIEV